MTSLELLGTRIKALRTELGMTQEELAKRAGYTSRSSINKIELGIVDISQSKIKLIAAALQTTPTYLLGWEDNSVNNGIIGNSNNHNVINVDALQGLSPVDSAILTIVKNLNDTQKSMVLAYAVDLIGKK